MPRDLPIKSPETGSLQLYHLGVQTRSDSKLTVQFIFFSTPQSHLGPPALLSQAWWWPPSYLLHCNSPRPSSSHHTTCLVTCCCATCTTCRGLAAASNLPLYNLCSLLRLGTAKLGQAGNHIIYVSDLLLCKLCNLARLFQGRGC